MTVLIGTPHELHDLAAGLAGAEDKTFDLLERDERERYYELAAWVDGVWMVGDDFHEGCVPRDGALDEIEQAWEDGYTTAGQEALEAIATLATNSGEAAKATLRLAYMAVRQTESRQALDAKTASYVQERRRALGG